MIFNEKDFGKFLYEHQTDTNLPPKTYTVWELSILAKYLRQELKKSEKEIKNGIIKFCNLNYPGFDVDVEYEKINKIMVECYKTDLRGGVSVPITKNELKTISQINNKKLEKLAFTILVLAKFCNMRNQNNNNWVMVDEYSVFKRAKITGTIQAQYSCFYSLAKMDLITYSRKVDNINVKVGFIDNESDIVLRIDDLRELGYQYLMYKGEKFIKCAECGIVTRATVHNKRYCKNCAGYQPILSKVIKCCDCGKEFEVKSSVKNKKRCDECQKEHVKEYDRKRKHK